MLCFETFSASYRYFGVPLQTITGCLENTCTDLENADLENTDLDKNTDLRPSLKTNTFDENSLRMALIFPIMYGYWRADFAFLLVV